ncbi:hypothetical protein GCG54_00008259 [Colletotrichum gloeosporioides]|uniref:Nephrocystin 3-like N-terminal domain-containing protein n=1 Tax=Colletotrichum gloeosporioides TaxID=474922 RepID=A0A8H4FEG1_COLGL|nr:uncharacterized protein GCG54_00008259 [Colletotrichum gloeosporioides]KAF3798801.1 hypothetical protein GCG54_00008259 [Colletotrichum gloeosporioides]
MAADQRPRRREDFRIAVLCALPLEYNAVTLAFDEFFDEDGDKFGRARGDPNRYTTGRIGKYNVVMALLASMGTLAFLVGICGGVPSPGTEKELLLGDVIISKTVVQYDFGRQNPYRFATKDTLSDSLGRPNKDIRSLLASLETDRTFERLERRTAEILTGIQRTAAYAGRKRTRYPYPGAAQDRLFSPKYEHRHRDDADCGCDDTWICDTAPDASCIELECDRNPLVVRESLEVKKELEREGNTAEAQKPHILIGSVGSGNTVMKSGAHRDEIAQRYDLIAFEMEAAGAWDEVPCLVIKGVCDYADSHKNKKWQTFAAATAASSMKALLELYIQTDSPGNSRIDFTTQRVNEILTWISKEPYKQHHTLNKSEVLEGTGRWLLEDDVFQSWKSSEASSILWLHGIPGSGKSKLTSIVVEDALQSSSTATVYFYCSRNPAEPGRSSPTSIVASIARQLAMPQPGADLLDAAVEAYRRFEESAFASQSLTLDQSKELIHKLLDSYRGQTITLIIDALDECHRETRHNLLDLLVSLLETPTIIKVFVSSRDDRDIVNELNDYRNLYLSSERNSEDIEIFVRSETSRLVSKGSLLRGSLRKEELRDKIIFELISNAHGMFRWASLHIQELCRQATDAAIEERLVKMPRTLEGLYQEILDKIEKRDATADRELAKNVFIWLLCAQQQFKSDVFLAMVSRAKNGSTPTITADQLLELCNNMVLFDETMDAFRFSHLSVREFLEGQFAYQITTAHALAAEQCIVNLADTPSILTPMAPVLEYSVYFWADHAKQADHEERQSRLCLILGNFFAGDQDPHSPFSRWHDRISYEDWSLNMYWDKVHKFKAVWSYPPSVLLVISMFDLSGILSPGRWQELAKAKPKSLDGAAPEDLVIRYGSIKVLQWQFEADIPFNLTMKHIEVAARNKENGVRILSLLLERFAADIRITPEVVKAAASNAYCGDIILSHLLQKRGHEINITADVVRAGVNNRGKAVEITSLLLNQHKSQIRITPNIVRAAIRSGAEVVKILLDLRGDEIEISADLILSAIRRSQYCLRGFFRPVLSFLLEVRRDQIHITEDFILSIAPQPACTRDVMGILLDVCEDDIQITGELFDAIVSNMDDRDELMALLLDRIEVKPEISDKMMELIVNNFNDATLRKFIDLYGDEIKVTNGIVMAAAKNGWCGEDVMRVLLNEYGEGIRITEDVLEAVFENEHRGNWIMEILLEVHAHEIHMSEKFIRMAVQSEPDMLKLILDKRGDEIHITDEIIQSCSHAENTMIIIRKQEKFEFQVSENILLQAAEQENGITEQEDGLLQFLLDHRMEKVRLTEDVVSAAAGNGIYGLRFITLLIDRCGDDIPITNKVLQAAAANRIGNQVMAVLLSWRGDSIRITENVVKAAIRNWNASHKVMAVLFTVRGSRIPVPEKALELAGATPSSYKVIRTLLEERGDTIRITEEAVKIAVRNSWCGNRILEVFLEWYEGEVPVSDRIVSLAAGNSGCGDKIMSLLLKKRRNDIRITREVIVAAAHNPKCGRRVLAAILDTIGIMCKEIEQLCETLHRSPDDTSHLDHKETVEILLNHNADDNAKGYESSKWSSKTEQTLTCRLGGRKRAHCGREDSALLATYYVDIDSRNCFGRTLLLLARRRKLVETLLLLETAKKGDLPPEDFRIGETDSQLSSTDTITPRTPSVLDCYICTVGVPENDTYYRCLDQRWGLGQAKRLTTVLFVLWHLINLLPWWRKHVLVVR